VGLDPQRCTIFVQSRILEHAELHLLLSMITPLGWLERVPTYKEKQMELKERDLSTYGFLGYPLLQAADIIIYRAKHVPVGVDQVPHLEISREIARRFNNLYGEVFPEPEALLTEFPKVPGVDGRKMSKSYNNAIYLSDTPQEVEHKIRTMATDPARVKRTDRGTPDLSPVFQLHKIFSSREEQEMVAEGCRTAGIGCIDCKKVLVRNVFRVLEPIWAKRAEFLDNPARLKEIVDQGNGKARRAAQETMALVRDAMGFY
jgi:tryptophanyl-tRNA synthetase